MQKPLQYSVHVLLTQLGWAVTWVYTREIWIPYILQYSKSREILWASFLSFQTTKALSERASRRLSSLPPHAPVERAPPPPPVTIKPKEATPKVKGNAKIATEVTSVITPPEAKKTASNTKEKASKKRNSGELGDDLFQDVEVVLTRLDSNSPAKELANSYPDLVFEKLEEVRRSPKRVELVCQQLINEASTQNQSRQATPANKTQKARPVLTRSARKSAAFANESKFVSRICYVLF